MIEAVTWLVVVVASASAVYQLAVVIAAVRFARRKLPDSPGAPPISILKPVRGADEGAVECFASFCALSYPEYELLFGVRDPTDAAIPVVEGLRDSHPECAITLVRTSQSVDSGFVNRKVANLAAMLPHARFNLLLISDSDMAVTPSYLQAVAQEFGDPKVGLVTSPYRGFGARTSASVLEGLGIATDWFPGVLAASQFVSPRFALGSTLALDRQTLAAIGGFEALRDYLADDFQIGCRVSGLGRRVALTRYVVSTRLPNAGWSEMLARRLRWMRTVRACQSAGYYGSFVTYTTLWCLCLLPFVFDVPVAAGVLAVAACSRLAGAVASIAALGDAEAAVALIALPISDLLSAALWVAGCFGHTVYWRGERFRLRAGGHIALASPTNRQR